MPTLNELRALSVALPPSERVQGAEAADLLSAIVAVGTYGDDLLHAAEEGKVFDFFHQRAVDHAQEHGHDEPVRGATTDVAPVTPVSQANQAIDYDKLAQAIVKAQRGNEDPAPDVPPAPTTDTVTPASPGAPVTNAPDTATGATAQPSDNPPIV